MDQQPNRGGHPNKASLQAYIQDFTREAIDGIVDIMRNSHNEQLKFAAQKLIIDKSIADVKAMELTGQNGEPIQLFINAGKGFFPTGGFAIATSEVGITGGQPPVQGSGMAPEGTQDNNSNNGAGQASTP
jgi:hypothetical protein